MGMRCEMSAWTLDERVHHLYSECRDRVKGPRTKERLLKTRHRHRRVSRLQESTSMCPGNRPSASINLSWAMLNSRKERTQHRWAEHIFDGVQGDCGHTCDYVDLNLGHHHQSSVSPGSLLLGLRTYVSFQFLGIAGSRLSVHIIALLLAFGLFPWNIRSLISIMDSPRPSSSSSILTRLIPGRKDSHTSDESPDSEAGPSSKVVSSCEMFTLFKVLAGPSKSKSRTKRKSKSTTLVSPTSEPELNEKSESTSEYT